MKNYYFPTIIRDTKSRPSAEDLLRYKFLTALR